MKPNEIVDEGKFYDAFAKKGWFGQKEKSKAYGRMADELETAERQAAKDKQERFFISDLSTQLEKAVRAGVVTLGAAESVEFEDLDSVFESRLQQNVLNEAVSVKDFVSRWTKRWLAKQGFKVGPESSSVIDRYASDIQSKYRPRKRFPTDLASKLYGGVMSAIEMGDEAEESPAKEPAASRAAPPTEKPTSSVVPSSKGAPSEVPTSRGEPYLSKEAPPPTGTPPSKGEPYLSKGTPPVPKGTPPAGPTTKPPSPTPADDEEKRFRAFRSATNPAYSDDEVRAMMAGKWKAKTPPPKDTAPASPAPAPAVPPAPAPAPAAPPPPAPAPTPTAPATKEKPAAPAKPAGKTPAELSAAQKQSIQNVNNYVQNVAKSLNATTDKNQKVALAKELINFMAPRKGYPEWDNALRSAMAAVKRGQLDPNFANIATQKLKAGQPIKESWKMDLFNKLLEAVDLTWEDLGVSESTNKSIMSALIASEKNTRT